MRKLYGMRGSILVGRIRDSDMYTNNRRWRSRPIGWRLEKASLSRQQGVPSRSSDKEEERVSES